MVAAHCVQHSPVYISPSLCQELCICSCMHESKTTQMFLLNVQLCFRVLHGFVEYLKVLGFVKKKVSTWYVAFLPA